MEVEKTKSQNIDIPKAENLEKKDVSVSPTWNWIGLGGILGTNTQLAAKLVTDPNILHHIKNAPKKTRKEVEDEIFKLSEEEKQSESEKEHETSDETSEEDDELEIKNNDYRLMEEYGEDLGNACLELKKSLMVDWDNIPNDVKIVSGAALTMYYDVFPPAAILFLSWKVLDGIIEARVDERIKNRLEDKNQEETESIDDFESSDEEALKKEDKKCV